MCPRMAHIIKGSHSFTCIPHFHLLTEWIIPAFASQPKLVLIYQPLRDGRLSRPGQLERWMNSRPRTATQCLSRLQLQLLTGQRHSHLTGQTGVSGLLEATTRQPPTVPRELTTSELQVQCLTDWATAPPTTAHNHGNVHSPYHFLTSDWCVVTDCRMSQLWMRMESLLPSFQLQQRFVGYDYLVLS